MPLRKAQSGFAGNYKGARYRLLSNWRISPSEAVCTENLSAGVMVVKSAKDGA
jgi:hypothetical protein